MNGKGINIFQNMNIGENSIKMIQTSKGIWNFEIQFFCDDPYLNLDRAEAIGMKANEVRKKLNKSVEEEEKKPKN